VIRKDNRGKGVRPTKKNGLPCVSVWNELKQVRKKQTVFRPGGSNGKRKFRKMGDGREVSRPLEERRKKIPQRVPRQIEMDRREKRCCGCVEA